jgi:hypothetical protein
MADDNLYLLLGRIEGKLDGALQRQERHEQAVEALSARVSSVERSRSWALGAAAVLGAMASTAKSFLMGALGL